MLHWLVFAETVGLVVGVPLLFLFMQERVKNLARESTEKALADYKHQHDQHLADINATHQRRLQEFGYYRQKRHAVYAKLYKRVSIAADSYGSMIGLTMRPDFANYTSDDASAYFERHEVPKSSSSPIIAAFSAGDRREAGKLLDDLHERVLVHSANRAFNQAKSYERVSDLYLSDAVRSQMIMVRSAIASVSVAVDRSDGRDRLELEKKNAMHAAVDELFGIMRAEMDQV